MWEFSWLVRRSGHESEYADWDRVLDELAQRGYDCIRLDVFPHLVAAGATGNTDARFTILPRSKRFSWGNHSPVTVDPRRGLIEFLGKVADRGMVIGASGWFNDDATHRVSEVHTPADYVRIWSETLSFLEQEGFHDLIEWVDLCNEFPCGLWAPEAYERVFGVRWPKMRPLWREWTDRQLADTQAYWDVLPQLKERWPNLRFTWSTMFIGQDSIRRLDPSPLDVAEPHVWISDDVRFCFRSGQLLALLETPGGIAMHQRLGPRVWGLWRDSWVKKLSARMDDWADWAHVNDLPLYTSEGWGPINYGDAPDSDGWEWEWVKDTSEVGVDLAIDKGWTGICTNNFCQPHFPGMWRDIAWHQAQTTKIKAHPESS